MISASSIVIRRYKNIGDIDPVTVNFMNCRDGGEVNIIKVSSTRHKKVEQFYYSLWEFRNFIVTGSDQLGDGTNISLGLSRGPDFIFYNISYRSYGKFQESITSNGELVIERSTNSSSSLELGPRADLIGLDQDDKIVEFQLDPITRRKPFILSTLVGRELYDDIADIMIQDIDPEPRITEFPLRVQELVRYFIIKLGCGIVNAEIDQNGEWVLTTYDIGERRRAETCSTIVRRLLSILPKLIKTALYGGLYCVPHLLSDLNGFLELKLLSIFQDLWDKENMGRLLFSGNLDNNTYPSIVKHLLI